VDDQVHDHADGRDDRDLPVLQIDDALFLLDYLENS